MSLNVEYIYRVIDKYSAPLKRIAKSTERVTASVRKSAKAMTKYGQSIKNAGRDAATFMTLPIVAMGAVMIKAASDAEETRSKYATIFQNISKNAENVADTFAQSFGLAGTKARELLGDTGDMLTGFGFTEKAALDLSKRTNELAVDLASFTNFSGGAEGASAALTKALLGERESIKSLGIAILEEDVKKKISLMRSKGITFATKRQAKAYATLELAIQQSKNAIGDYDRTKTAFANTLRRVQSRLQDFNEEFGRVLLPYAKELLIVIERLLIKFKGLDEKTKLLIVAITGLLAVVGPILIVIGLLVKSVGLLITGMFALSSVLITLGSLGVGVMLGKWTFGVENLRTAWGNLIQDIKNSMNVFQAIGRIGENFNVGVLSLFSEDLANKAALRYAGNRDIANTAASNKAANTNVNLGGSATIKVDGPGETTQNNISLNTGNQAVGAQ